MIWGAMAIPVVVALFLYFFYQRKTLWWEFLIPFGASIVLIAGFKYSIEAGQVKDKEFWGGTVQVAEYYEDWDEEVPCTHEIPCSHTKYCKDNKGREYACGTKHSNDGYRHKYDVDYHPPYWNAHDSNGITIGINSGVFERLCGQFGNKTFVDLHRNYHSNDGDKYVTKWNGEKERFEPVTTVHTYENRVQASGSIFNFCDVNPKTYGLFEYPDVNGYYTQPLILGSGGPTQAEAEKRLQWWNATLGPKRQVRIFILVFQNQPLQAGFDQENYWKGGNKNEFIVTMGVDGQNRVQWSHAISWTEAEELKIETRDWVSSMGTLDLTKLVDWLGPEVEKKWKRKHFRDFSYLSVEPPLWAVLLAYFVTLAANLGVSYWAVRNQYSEDQPRPQERWR